MAYQTQTERILYSMKADQLIGQCIYCGTRPATQTEHVVARQFFPPSLRENLITVPSCAICNALFQPHEEYLRLLLGANSEAIQKNAAAKQIHDTKTLPAIRKRVGLRRLLMRAVRRARVLGHDGRVIGSVPILETDMARAKVVCEKIVRGLLWDQYAMRLPEGYTLELWANISDTLREQLEKSVCEEPSHKSRRLGGGVFEFWAAQGDGDSGQTVWLCAFYDTFYFAATTGPAELMTAFRRRFSKTENPP